MAGRSFGEQYEVRCVLCCSVSLIPQLSKLLSPLERKASGGFAQAEFQLTQIIVIIFCNDQPIIHMKPKRMIFTNCKHLLLLYLTDICEEGGSEL